MLTFMTARELSQMGTTWTDHSAEVASQKLAEAEQLIDDAVMELGGTRPKFPMHKRDALASLSSRVQGYKYQLLDRYSTTQAEPSKDKPAAD